MSVRIESAFRVWFVVMSVMIVAPGSTVAAAPAGGPALELVEVLTGLDTAVDVVHAGDERLFIAQQDGEILVWDGASAPTTFLDLSAIVGGGFEGGIKSIAFHPSYPTPGYVFVHYSDTINASVVARYTVSADPDVADPLSGVVVLTQPQATTLHRGGQIAFGPDGFLYIGLGDGGPQTDPDCHAQRPDTLQGKLMRIDIDQNTMTPPYYGIPGDNPFGGVGQPAAEVWAIGLRQPWRFSFDRVTGDLYIADVGQFEREEIDFQAAGAGGGQNYGWRIMEGTFCFDPDPIDDDCPMSTPSCDDPGFVAPIIEYDHTGGNCSVTGGFVYQGPEAAALRGRYLYGDWCTGNLWAAEDGGSGWTTELLSVSLPQINTFGEDRDGRLFLTNGSTLFRLRAPNDVFGDGFESGDTSAWSSTVQ
ncbi:MAG: PQQ-dependent sugar dehydrogenase [Acidobacteriota bacterium]